MCLNRKSRKKISMIVPFQSDDPFRRHVWHWLKRYWEDQIPDVEIVIGTDRHSRRNWHRRYPQPFSKTAAVNNAFKKTHGDIIVIMDADTYMDGSVIKHCAERIRHARKAGLHLWFVPYQWIFRLTERATYEVLDSDPCHPLRFPTPPPDEDVEGTDGSGWGRRFGALVQIMPREAFESVEGMDERFRGWGGEDVSLLRALDTLWGKHKNTPNEVLHLWHPRFIAGEWTDDKGNHCEVRAWEGQAGGHANDWLSTSYHNATNDKGRMNDLINEKDAGRLKRKRPIDPTDN